MHNIELNIQFELKIEITELFENIPKLPIKSVYTWIEFKSFVNTNKNILKLKFKSVWSAFDILSKIVHRVQNHDRPRH